MIAAESTNALVIGAGPAGLMAAEVLAAQGHQVLIVDAMRTPARKFLMAGKTGLNITKAESIERFLRAYHEDAAWLEPIICQFGPEAIQAWVRGLDQDIFTGSTGRVFPVKMKASPLLRAWLGRLNANGAALRVGWRWIGWTENTAQFETPEGMRYINAKTTVLALGGASWKRLGSDGAWLDILEPLGIGIDPFQPSNVGLKVNWSHHMEKQFGAPVKGAALVSDDRRSRGEFVISRRGLEGAGVYAMIPSVRQGKTLYLDLLPDIPLRQVQERISRQKSKQTLNNLMRKALGLSPARIALLREFSESLPSDAAALAEQIKSLPIRHAGMRPIDEAISVAGGLRRGAMNEKLMLTSRPGVFCAGEMLSWDAPTGGYLLTACLATGRFAGRGASDWISDHHE